MTTMFEMMRSNPITNIALILLLTISIGSFGQDNKTVKPTEENNEMDSILNDLENSSNVFVVNPANDLYKDQWEDTNIRYNFKDFLKRNDTIAITLVNPEDNPFFPPHKGKVISKYGPRSGRMHTGTDIKLNRGDSIFCAFDGKVRLAKRFSGYGNLVLVRHYNGLETVYAHLDLIRVNVNDTIKAGDLIGFGGRTGRATTEHLHFETRLFGEPFDSNKYIDFENFTLRVPVIYYKNRQVVNDLQQLRKPTDVPSSTLALDPDATKHVIQKGDNLWTIAKMYNTTVKSICNLNNITTQQILKIGTTLYVKQ